MKHNNISIFITHIGCPHMCSFCNQKAITGVSKEDIPRGDDVKRILKKALSEINEEDRKNTQIAFFGGSFTAVDRDYMLELLDSANEFIGEGKFSSIRFSTRPDAIDEETLEICKQKKVRSIELGVQSMDDEVLLDNERGHTKEDVIRASKLIKEHGFDLTLQMMVGLYKSTPEKDIKTAKEIINLSPKEARIYPVAILKGTLLAKLYESGEYVPYTLEEGVLVSAKILSMFEESGINVIKLGLHSSKDVSENLVGGLYHPAFRELCESIVLREKIKLQIEKTKNINKDNIAVYVNEFDLSKAIGQKKSNIEYFKSIGMNVKIKPYKNKNIKIV